VVGDDLALVRDLLADQDGAHVRLHQLRLTHVADAELKKQRFFVSQVPHPRGYTASSDSSWTDE
jgi:hypothetical protein